MKFVFMFLISLRSKHWLLKSLIAVSVMIGPATQAMTLEKAEGTLKVQRAFSMHTSARKYSNSRSSIFFPRVSTV